MQRIPTNLIWPIVVLLIAFGAFFLRPWETKTTQTVTVTATGSADATPNVGKITANIESKNPNIDTARAENQEKMSTVVNKLKEIGVEEKDIKTQNISAGQAYTDAAEPLIYPAPPRPDTNSFSTSLEITIRDFAKTDAILTTLTQNGLTNLYGPQLTLSDDKTEEAKTQAREDAVENARKKAGELAKASGRNIGNVVKIAEGGDYGYPVPMMARDSVDLAEKASSIQPGQNEITVNLTIEFQLK